MTSYDRGLDLPLKTNARRNTMRRLPAFLTRLFVFVSIPAWYATAQVEMGVSITEEGLKSFYLAVGDYYKVPEREVVLIRKRRMPDDEIPVVFFIARSAGVSPATIIELRLGGKSWMDITFHFGLTAGIYYVEVQEVKGPPYGKAYGYFKKTPRKQWKKIVLADDDVVNLVNLKFVSEHFGYSAGEVIKMRAKGKSFVGIHDKMRKAKKQQEEKTKGQRPKKKPKGKREKHD